MDVQATAEDMVLMEAVTDTEDTDTEVITDTATSTDMATEDTIKV